jgi:hypothetical protein
MVNQAFCVCENLSYNGLHFHCPCHHNQHKAESVSDLFLVDSNPIS